MTVRTSAVKDLTARQRGNDAAPLITWRCMGCNQSRVNLGSRGAGVRRRCAHCVAEREAACN